jgi:23S rRNA (guanosine2251-2'-O)-methyltransferase
MLTDARKGVKHTPERPRHGSYVACGPHAVGAFLRARPKQVRELLVARDLPAELIEAARAARVEAVVTAPGELDRRTGGVVHQGVVACGEPPAPWAEEDIFRRRPSPLLIVDGVTDPRNVGAMFRTAEAAGTAAVALARDHAPALTPALVKAAAGAVEWLPHARITNVARLIGLLREEGYWVIGLDAEAPVSIWEPNAIPGFPVALVVGAEDRGLRSLVRKSCHALVSIPMAGETASLNVSAAAAVALFEVARRVRETLSEGRTPIEP